MLVWLPSRTLCQGCAFSNQARRVPALLRKINLRCRTAPNSLSSVEAAVPPGPGYVTALQLSSFTMGEGTSGAEPKTIAECRSHQRFRELLAERGYNGGVPITREFFNEHIAGGHNTYLGPYLWPDASPEEQLKFMEDKEVVFREKAAGILKPIGGLPEFLAWIDRNGLGKAAVTRPVPSPTPDPYLEGLRVLGLKPEEVIVVEDSPAGVTAGKAAGIPTVGILTSQAPDRLEAAGAVSTIHNYHQLLDLVQGTPSGASL
eukprot:jgi/Botrbrau1/4925/Bobra.0122s0007.1